MSLHERTARLETKAEHQEQFNTSICETITEVKKHLRRIELIALAALITFGLERGASMLGILPGGLLP